MINDLLKIRPFSLSSKKKQSFFLKKINELTNYHYKNCKEYNKILNLLGFNLKKNYLLNQIPFIPARLFKSYDLITTNKISLFRTLRSSGTSSSKVSKIYLDKINVNNQIRVLTKIVGEVLGQKRLPMLIVDKKKNLESTTSLSARNAAIRGFSIFGKNHTYLINNSNEIDYDLLNLFLEKFGKSKFLVFGFTIDIFNFLINKIDSKKLKNDFRNAFLLHGGGWKKIEENKINNEIFKSKLLNKIKIKNVFNYYGMVEQTGSIFIECKCGKFITSIFSDIIIRDEKLNILKKNKKGLIQLFSLLPTSYPGHSILTEDIGEILDEDGCKKCQLNGKSFIVHGRAKQSEVRGCSDV